MPKAILYSEVEGGEFLPVPEGIWITSREARGWDTATVQVPDYALGVHCFIFDDGSRWDTVSGFKEGWFSLKHIDELLEKTRHGN